MSAARDLLDLLGAENLPALLASHDPREQLRGIHAAVELSALGLIGELEALRTGPERAVTAAAARAVERLALDLLDLGARRLEQERTRQPDRSALFPRLGDADTRRAVLLDLLGDGGTADEDICAILRSGLADPDWQVRITALLISVRLHASAVGAAVRAIDVASARLDRRHRSALHEARRAALAELAGLPPPAGDSPRDRLAVAMRAAVAGRSWDHPEPLLGWIAGFASGPLA